MTLLDVLEERRRPKTLTELCERLMLAGYSVTMRVERLAGWYIQLDRGNMHVCHMFTKDELQLSRFDLVFERLVQMYEDMP